ncbi:MAG: CvpA family protein [Candidatus Levybacteria bacterium]|nr:CvpA family protein [Candidatus Levybacteria bacterium]
MDSMAYLNQISQSFLSGFNWVDVIILFVFAFYIIEGYAVGFVNGIIDFLSFLVSFLIALKYYAFFGNLLTKAFSLSMGFSNALGFMLAAFVSEFVISAILRRFAILSFVKAVSNLKVVRINNLLGIIPGFLSSTVIVTFFLTLIVSLPLSPSLKNYIFESKIGNFLVSNTQGFEKSLNNVFGGAALDTLNFLTVEPKSDESLNLKFTTNKVSVDKESEQEMFVLVNEERRKEGLAGVVFDEALAQVGRKHCEDMLRRGYFSHYTPEGLSPFDRMDKAGISYSYAGENLALAPNVAVAMRGLMESPGHRANILSFNFGRMGVGVIDGGVYGEMFCQEFSD